MRYWYGKLSGVRRCAYILLPLVWLFWALSSLRRKLYQWGVLTSYRASKPVLVVGNIAVGGTGKTPIVLALVEQLQARGLRPGVVSRGYGAQGRRFPHAVSNSDLAVNVGDEPLLIRCRSGVPVVIDPRRAEAVRHLCQHNSIDVVIADDGLQHYALQRDIECVVIDGQRRHGNGWLMPLGPLREPVARLQEVDFIFCNGEASEGEVHISLVEADFRHLVTGKHMSIEQMLSLGPKVAIAGIGHPERFFGRLKALGFTLHCCAFPDHYSYTDHDLSALASGPLLMTEKDAVKCRCLVRADDCWYLHVDAVIPSPVLDRIVERIAQHSQENE